MLISSALPELCINFFTKFSLPGVTPSALASASFTALTVSITTSALWLFSSSVLLATSSKDNSSLSASFSLSDDIARTIPPLSLSK